MSTAVLISALGELPILAGSLRQPERGQWSAVVEVHSPAALVPGDDATIALAAEDGTRALFVGRVRATALDGGRAQVSATVAGALGLDATIEPRDYAASTTEIRAGIVARQICDDAGEQLADGVEVVLDAFQVAHWTRVSGSARSALDLLADVLGLAWRVLPSGRVWMGAETWPEAEPPRRVGVELEDGRRRYAPDGAELAPGTTVIGHRVVDVVYFLSSARAEARHRVEGDPPLTSDRTLYARSHGATIVSQDSAGRVELVPDDPRLGSVARPLRGIPIRVGLPGCVVAPTGGMRARLAFDGADPRRPFVFAFDEARPGTTSPLALVGDSCGWIAVTAPPGGGPCTIAVNADGAGLGPLAAQILVVGPGHEFVRGASS